MTDGSNGYEAIAEAFIQARRRHIGPTVVRKWAEGLRAGTSILDLGCGSGVPISEALLQEGFSIYGVDASSTMIAKFHDLFPSVPLECNPVESSLFFIRSFDAAIGGGCCSCCRLILNGV